MLKIRIFRLGLIQVLVHFYCHSCPDRRVACLGGVSEGGGQLVRLGSLQEQRKQRFWPEPREQWDGQRRGGRGVGGRKWG